MKNKLLCSVLACAMSAFSLPATVHAVDPSDNTELEKYFEILQSCPSAYEPIYERQIKPAELSEDGTLPYVAQRHIQELNGLVFRCSDAAELSKIAENRTVQTISDYLAMRDEAEALDGRVRNTEHDSISAYQSDDVYVADLYYGPYPTKEEQRSILASILENPSMELLGILQTDWYLKGYYDEMNTELYIVPEEGCEVRADELYCEEYCKLKYSPSLSDYQLNYLKDLPSNTGSAKVLMDMLSFEEITALCEKLEARDDIAYAWIVPVYLEDMMCNAGDYGYSVKGFNLAGDVNKDGVVDADDANKVLYEYLRVGVLEEEPEFTEEEFALANVYPDNLLNADDSDVIRCYYLYTIMGGKQMTVTEFFESGLYFQGYEERWNFK